MSAFLNIAKTVENLAMYTFFTSSPNFFQKSNQEMTKTAMKTLSKMAKFI
jgi:hypothetical protein